MVAECFAELTGFLALDANTPATASRYSDDLEMGVVVILERDPLRFDLYVLPEGCPRSFHDDLVS